MRKRIEPTEDLDRLYDERDHVAIKISLALDATPLDTRRVELLKTKFKQLEHRIHVLS